MQGTADKDDDDDETASLISRRFGRRRRIRTKPFCNRFLVKRSKIRLRYRFVIKHNYNQTSNVSVI